MKKILVIESSPQRSESFSNKLSNAIVQRLKKSWPDAQVITRDLASNPPPLLTKVEFGSYSDQAIQEVLDADAIVIGVATHNFSVPAVLKAWIDQVSVAKKTFGYTAEGPKGLVIGKKVYLSIASGSIASAHPEHDFIAPYLKSILGFLGMTDLQTFRVEGLAIPGVKEGALEKAIEQVSRL